MVLLCKKSVLRIATFRRALQLKCEGNTDIWDDAECDGSSRYWKPTRIEEI